MVGVSVNNKGISLLEVVMAVGLLFIVVSALVQLGITTLRTSDAARVRIVAQQLANEGLELARVQRDADPNAFFALDTSNPNYWWSSAAFTSGNMGLTPTSCDPSNLTTITSNCVVTGSINDQTVNFYRVFNIVDVVSGDPNNKEVTVHVFWNKEGNTSPSNLSTSTRLTRWRN